MIWIILLFSMTVVCGFIATKRNNDSGEGFVVVLMLLFVFVSPLIICSGANDYSDLVAQREEVLTLQGRVKDIKAAYYKNKNKGTLIAGDIANIKQSTALTDYIAKLASKEAAYNKELKNSQLVEEMTIYRWLLDGMFIFDEIHDLERAE
jgi:hypothetical protein